MVVYWLINKPFRRTVFIFNVYKYKSLLTKLVYVLKILTRTLFEMKRQLSF